MAISEKSSIFAADFANAEQMVGVAQLVRVPDCGSEGRGFESHLPPKTREVRESLFFCWFPRFAEKCVLLHLKLKDMARIMAIDLGRKRSGIAVTDPLQIIANGLTTVESHKLVDFVLNYLKTEEVEQIVIGEPKDMKNNPSDCSKYIEPIVNRLKKLLPDMKIVRYDERFTSVMAHQTMIDAGLSKSKRQDKELVDTIAATIILQSYMESIKMRSV